MRGSIAGGWNRPRRTDEGPPGQTREFPMAPGENRIAEAGGAVVRAHRRGRRGAAALVEEAQFSADGAPGWIHQHDVGRPTRTRREIREMNHIRSSRVERGHGYRGQQELAGLVGVPAQGLDRNRNRGFESQHAAEGGADFKWGAVQK